MYLELIFTGIKTDRWKGKIAYPGIEASRKDCPWREKDQ